VTGPAGADQADDERSGLPLCIPAQAGNPLQRGDDRFNQVIDALPAAVYITDVNGLITYYNEAAAGLWGWHPELGKTHWCGSWKLRRPDGKPLPRDQCTMAVAVRDRRVISGVEAIAERPNGVLVPFLSYPTLLHDASGALIGAVNMLVDITDRKRADEYAQRLASIVESSDDAIVAKDLNGVITSWNLGAERLFGYSADEAIGSSVTILIPPDRLDEEPEILARIRNGERVNHYETVRCRKDGSALEISLTVSPIRGPDGAVIGASKIARDITERRRSIEQERLLLREMSHRVKNLFALAGSIVTLSARSAKTPKELAASVGDRLAALARAHELTLPYGTGIAGPGEQIATLYSLIKTVVSPYEDKHEARLVLTGSDVRLSATAVSALALIVHEFATNSAKYGSLSVPAGRIAIDCAEDGDRFVLVWTEQDGPTLGALRGEEGFGSLMTRAAAKGQLGGTIEHHWAADGLTIRLSMSRERLKE
jgi:PAS domain S-box-containing protein